jgi:hypothetical protein
VTIYTDKVANEAGTGPTELTGQSAAKQRAFYDHINEASSETLNTSSTTDVQTGQYDVAFTNAFSSADYVVSGMCGNQTNSGGQTMTQGLSDQNEVPTVNDVRLQTLDTTSTNRDCARTMNTIYGTLA